MGYWDGARCVLFVQCPWDFVEIDGVRIKRLDGRNFEKTSVIGKTAYYAALSQHDGFAANVNILLDVADGKLPSIEEFLASTKSQYKILNGRYSVSEQSDTTALISVRMGSLCMYQKVLRDHVGGRFVVVTGTYKDESDRWAIKSCVDSARLAMRSFERNDGVQGGGNKDSEFRNVLRGAKPSSLSSSSYFTKQRDSAEEAIKGALATVRSRYRRTLDYYGLKESFFCNRPDIKFCSLLLLDASNDMLKINYGTTSNTIEWPRLMPKGVAEQLIHDRMLIDAYEKSTSSGW